MYMISNTLFTTLVEPTRNLENHLKCKRNLFISIKQSDKHVLYRGQTND